jgi:hypothetical protein
MPSEVRRKGLIPDIVTADNHRKYWRRSMESTSSEPRGLHNGHYKAGAPESELVSKFGSALRNIPYHTGYALLTWCNITYLAIEKVHSWPIKCALFSSWLRNTTPTTNSWDATWWTMRKAPRYFQRNTMGVVKIVRRPHKCWIRDLQWA